MTSFEYRLHPVCPVLGDMVLPRISQATEVLRFYREFTASQPDEQTWAGILPYRTVIWLLHWIPATSDRSMKASVW